MTHYYKKTLKIKVSFVLILKNESRAQIHFSEYLFLGVKETSTI